MSTRDPEHIETQHLKSFADFTGNSILEVGVGNGRLTWRYADLCQSVVAIDPSRDVLNNAQYLCPDDLKSKITFLNASALDLPLDSSVFEGAILAWSL